MNRFHTFLIGFTLGALLIYGADLWDERHQPPAALMEEAK